MELMLPNPGPRSDMLDLERLLSEIGPGDENLEPWSRHLSIAVTGIKRKE